MRTFRSRGATLALVVAIAIGFFFAGYCASAIRVAEAKSSHPIVTPPPPDGNPVGHQLNPPKNLAAPPQIDKYLSWLAKHEIAINYVLAPRNGQPWHPAPRCNGRPHCYDFQWKNMTIQHVNYNGTSTKVWPVDVYGTFSI
ncbi:MAG TPA: hypothetical protein VMT95_01645 [Candidatus Binatia bacterium]|nr:hypothetical protein [Candidatus Binatia bacterium]